MFDIQHIFTSLQKTNLFISQCRTFFKVENIHKKVNVTVKYSCPETVPASREMKDFSLGWNEFQFSTFTGQWCLIYKVY